VSSSSAAASADCARHQARRRQRGVEVTLIDRRNHHLFQPLLYQVAMAGLSPAEIAYPIRTIFSGKRNVQVLLGRATGVDLARKLLRTDDAEIPYDNLILACGARHSYFGHNEWETYAPGLKSLEEATEIRRRVLTAFELAEKETDPDRQHKLLTFIVVGGGPTGVELAGALGEISRFTLSATSAASTPGAPASSSSRPAPASSRLRREASPARHRRPRVPRRHRLDLHQGHPRRRDGVDLGEESLQAATILWAAGVAPSAINKSLGVPLDRGGRVIVEQDCSLKDHPEVFVLGDQANFTASPPAASPANPSPASPPSPCSRAATSPASSSASSRANPANHSSTLDKGQMATIGRRRAIVEFGRLKFAGFFAWLAWLFIHILYLIGFKNRLEVILNWGWNYFAFSRGARLIVGKDWRSASTNAPAPRDVVNPEPSRHRRPPRPPLPRRTRVRRCAPAR
jgi:NADH dehydrogenase